jgi:hypothetical protein
MTYRDSQPYLVLVFLMAATLGITWWKGAPDRTAGPAVKLDLPGEVGEWRGEEVVFCQRPTCLLSMVPGELKEGACPACRGDVSKRSISEQQLLPADTWIAHRRYEDPRGRVVHVTLVVSGVHRWSIHRPEWCLPGQGYRVRVTETAEVPLPGRNPLPVKVLTLTHPAELLDATSRKVVFAYWFCGDGVETASQVERVWHMARESIFRGVRYRWAYVTVHSGGALPQSDLVATVTSFTAQLQPAIAVK